MQGYIALNALPSYPTAIYSFVAYHAYSIILFTAADVKTILIPIVSCSESSNSNKEDDNLTPSTAVSLCMRRRTITLIPEPDIWNDVDMDPSTHVQRLQPGRRMYGRCVE